MNPNVGIGMGLIVVIAAVIMFGFMIAIDRITRSGKKDSQKDNSAPAIGTVEIVEADGKYAVRQFGWRKDRDIVFYPTKSRLGDTVWEDSPEWHYFDELGQPRYFVVAVSLEYAKDLAMRLRMRYNNHVNWCKACDRENEEYARIKNAFENGKVIG